MIGAAAALIAAQAAATPSAASGVALFRQVCVDRSVAAGGVTGTPITIGAMPADARGALAHFNNAYETLDVDGGKYRAIALPGSETFLIAPAAGAGRNALTPPSCIVLWKAQNLAEARSYRPPYEAHVALERAENKGWIVLRAIPTAFAPPAPPQQDR
jgi:hypothetical protein